MRRKEDKAKLDNAKDVVSAAQDGAATAEAMKEAEAANTGADAVEDAKPEAADAKEAEDAEAKGAEAQEAGTEDAPKKRGTRKKAKEEEKPEAKPSAKKPKEELRPEVCVQFEGQEASLDDIVQRVKDQHIAEGHRAGNIKNLRLYIKPEERAAYYVINEKHDGRVDLF